MSWHVESFEVDDADSAWKFAAHPQVGYAEEDSKQVIARAVEIARGIIRNGLAGANGPYRVELSGHANPDGVAEGPGSADTISIRVTGSRPPKATKEGQ